MGKSARSCFNIITCSRDSAGYDDHEPLQSRASSDRRRWSFQKRSAHGHIESNSVILEPPPPVSNNKESHEASHNSFYPPEDSFSFEKFPSPRNMNEIPHISLDTECSKVSDPSSVTEERTKADAAVKESAATVIQAALRRYLALKEMKKLKSIIKLQAAIRGHLVRRQAAGTLRCVHAIIKMQSLVRARFVHRSVQNLANQGKHDILHEMDSEGVKSSLCGSTSLFQEKESSGTKHRKTHSATEKLLMNGLARQLFETTSNTKPIHIDCDPSRSDSAWKWLERWMALASLDIGQQQELNTNCKYQDQSKDTRVNVSELGDEVPVAVACVSENSHPTSVLPADGEQLIMPCASDFEFQAPANSDECFFPPIKAHWGCNQPKNDLLNEAQENHTKDKATEVSNSGGIILKPGPVSESPDADVDKPEFEKEKSNHVDNGVECGSLEIKGQKFVFERRQVCNPTFIAAQSKFKDLCSAGSLKSVGTSKRDVSVGSRPESSSLDYFTKGDVSFTADSASHAPGGQTTTSECDTELSISSTLDSPDRSETEGGEIILEIGSFGSRDFDVNGHSENASKNLNPEAENLSSPEIIQTPRVETIHENATNSIASDDCVRKEKQYSLDQHLAESILSNMQVQQEKVINQETCRSSPEGSPRRSHITGLKSHKAPSSWISPNTKRSNNENNMHERKQKSQVAVKRSLSDLNNDSSGRSSTENSRNGEKRNSFRMPKFDHADHEPRISSSNPLPNYMQTTESARAKVHTSNSPKSNPDVHDNDGYTKKRHSLPLANGKQVSSPCVQQLSSQTQQISKGNEPHSPHKSAERRWQR